MNFSIWVHVHVQNKIAPCQKGGIASSQVNAVMYEKIVKMAAD